MKRQMSELQNERLNFKPIIPSDLKDVSNIFLKEGEKTKANINEKQLQSIFVKTFGKPIMHLEKAPKKENSPIKVGVVFSGGQASGGHNVITGIFDALKELNKDNILIGFLNGPSGIVNNEIKTLTDDVLQSYRNQGGFDLIGSGRTKIETKEQLEKSLKTVNELDLDGLVVIGGDDSNTNAAVLAEYFENNNCKTRVIGVPKTIDGDLRNEHIEISFGFDTACKVYSELIGNIATDSLSAKKYYHFIKLMGRSASHIALECALKTHPNITIIGEEVEKENKTLKEITNEIADIIEKRSSLNKNYGIVLIPEGLIEFIPEMKILISELNTLLAENTPHHKRINSMSLFEEKVHYILDNLTDESKKAFLHLTDDIQKQLLLDRDPHGNVQVSLIETEKLLIQTVSSELKKRKSYKGKFKALSHFFGYEGRSGMPSNFDAQYCYSLGRWAAVLINEGLTGYMSCVYDLNKPVENWKAKAVPITMLMNIEIRQGKPKPVIKKALVELDSKAFLFLLKNRKNWHVDDCYLSCGAIQYFGNRKITDTLPITIREDIND